MWISKDNRKRLWVLIGILAGASLMLSSRGRASVLLIYTVQEIKPKVFVWIPDDVIDQECDPQFTRPGTAGFVVTAAGVVVIDTTNSPIHARDLLYEIRRRSDLAIRYVINTSSAGDHILGNEVFTDEQATLISTRTAQTEMQQYRDDLYARLHGQDGWKLQARLRGIHVTPSTEAFDEKMTLDMSDQEIRIVSLLHSAATPEDAAVYLPAAKTLFLGELFDNRYFPRVGSRDVRRWIEVLRQVEGWDVDTYIPGHGAPGGKRDVADFRQFLEWLVAQVQMRLQQGKSPEDVQRALYLPRTYNWHAPDLAPDTVADVCRQLAPAPATPSPTQPSGH
jgi:glyoxylase-like metal-dependent hydrolase (beta-lactamase superfamily II)